MQLPTRGRYLLHTPKNIRERKRQLIIPGLKVDSTFIEFDSFQPIHRSDRRWRSIDAPALRGIGLCRRQPPLQVPAAFRISHQNQARLIERHGPKFKMSTEQAPPSQASAQVFRTKKVFVAEQI